MEINNNSVWSYYKKDWVHPEFVPYLRANRKDQFKNTVDTNIWEKQGSPALVNDQLTRVNYGMRFMRQFETDVCPPGWKKAPPHANGFPSAYCERDDLPSQPVFYTDKAFIAKNQNFKAYTKPNIHSKKVMNARASEQPRLNMTYNELQPSNVSDTFDMRSINPYSGKYTTYFDSKIHNKNRYVNVNVVDGLRGEWYKPRESGYGSLPMNDSYL